MKAILFSVMIINNKFELTSHKTTWIKDAKHILASKAPAQRLILASLPPCSQISSTNKPSHCNVFFIGQRIDRKIL